MLHGIRMVEKATRELYLAFNNYPLTEIMDAHCFQITTVLQLYDF